MNFLSLLTVLFIGLKLTNNIDWSWFWVLSPLLYYPLIYGFILVFAFVAATVIEFSERFKK